MLAYLCTHDYPGDPEPQVTWYKDEAPIEPEADTRITIHCQSDLHILIIEDADRNDAGEYMALAANEHGSFRYRITVIVADDEQGHASQQRKIRKTVTTKRTVSVVEETLVDGQVVERTIQSEEITEDAPSVHDRSIEEASVRIEDVTEKITPSLLLATRVVQTDEPNDLETVNDGSPPTFTEPPEPVYVDVGDDINLSCRVQGQRV